jgi:alkyl hydroperoxide reductase subunit AhpC
MIAKLLPEFKARNCKVIGLSQDSVERHEGWIRDVNETQETEVTFPIVADQSGDVAHAFGMAHPNAPGAGDAGHTVVRSTFIIDPDKRLQVRMMYPSYVGRNFYEVLRTLDALQLALYHKVATPANWKMGEDVVILPSISNEMLARDPGMFPKGFSAIKPYLRITPSPDM